MTGTLRPMEPAPVRPDDRTIRGEILVVLSLSVLASAAYAIVSLFQAPLRGATVAAADQSPLFANQVIGFVFGLAPVALVLHLLHRDGEGAGSIGLTWDDLDWLRNETSLPLLVKGVLTADDAQRWALEGLREARGGGSGNRIRPVKEAAATAPAAGFLA